MMAPQGDRHARYRALSVPAGSAIAVDREPRNLNVNGQHVDVWAEHPEDAAWVCPHCSTPLPLYDHAEERAWRHLDRCQFQTYLHARIPCVACGAHGVVQVLVPWAAPRSRFTRLFERLTSTCCSHAT